MNQNYKDLAEKIIALSQPSQPAQYPQAPAETGGYVPSQRIDPMQLINPIYTGMRQQQQPDPLQMYRDYKQSGVMPQMASQYQAYTPPPSTQQAQTPSVASVPAFSGSKPQGGK